MLKLGPRPSRADARAHLSTPRRAVLELLVEEQEPLTVAQVAQTLDQHPNTVREHLEALARSGLAKRDQLAPVGRGRPASVYTYAPEASFTSPEYAVLAQVIIGYLTHVVPDGPELRRHAREMGRHWGRAILERAGGEPAPTTRTAGAAVAYLRRMLDRTGFAPEMQREGADQTLRLPRCPVLELAKDRPEVVCSAHLGMAREILASTGGIEPDRVSLEAFTQPGACLLHVRSVAHPGEDLVVGPVENAPAPARPDEVVPARPVANPGTASRGA
ncbi:transcriptional regulator [Georgenia soli]|uniref:Transcriptional regulator n=1 Tax=Georgenia soli TaxID=638953 RepID=A0A2A9EK65_9MICO|nr:helix-turn-helix domain-containing protein [Georgenia soli]PFG38652.1 transcriptional regulator [Georgenia soli]